MGAEIIPFPRKQSHWSCEPLIANGRRIDLTRHLVKRPEATFYLQVSGDGMKDASINSGDLLIVDRSCEVREGDIGAFIIDGEAHVRRLVRQRGQLLLAAANPACAPISFDGVEVWGKVLHVIHTIPSASRKVRRENPE